MKFRFAYSTDVGIRKKTNQDSLCISEASTPQGDVIMAAVCDGMGGLIKGELASKTIIEALESWFAEQLPDILRKSDPAEETLNSWYELICRENERILSYGKRYSIQLGSTVTAVMIFPDGRLVMAHVGDSRLYRLTDSDITQLTEDQTFVAREIAAGRMTPEEAENDPRKNVLLQCVGATEKTLPQFLISEAKAGESYLLCSDGFRHKISEDEMRGLLSPRFCISEDKMREGLTKLIELNMKRRESDNITALLVNTI